MTFFTFYYYFQYFDFIIYTFGKLKVHGRGVTRLTGPVFQISNDGSRSSSACTMTIRFSFWQVCFHVPFINFIAVETVNV